MRALLGLEHVHSHSHGLDEAEHELQGPPVGWELRVAGLFVIFAASMCSLVTVWFKSTDSVMPRLLRTFGGGVITALAVVHIIPEAMEQLSSVPIAIPIPLGPCAILVGVILMVLTDSLISSLLAPPEYKQQVRTEHNTSVAQQKTGFICSHSCPDPVAPSEAKDQMQKVKHGVNAFVMELGCIFHSVVIGIGVGVMTGDKHLMVTMITALAVHQGLEGLALGSVLALTDFSTLKKVFMLFLYSLTTPVGIAVGIAIASAYEPESLINRAVQGGLNGISAGLLLYIGLHQLIAEEFSKADLTVRPGLRFGMFVALIVGAAMMCGLGMWA